MTSRCGILFLLGFCKKDCSINMLNFNKLRFKVYEIFDNSQLYFYWPSVYIIIEVYSKLPWKNVPVNPLLHIYDVCFHISYKCDDIMYQVRYLLIGWGEIGWGVPKQSYKFWAKLRAYRYKNPNIQLVLYTEHFILLFFMGFWDLYLVDQWTLRRSISKSLLCIPRCITLFFCNCNVSKNCFLLVWKANIVKVGE